MLCIILAGRPSLTSEAVPPSDGSFMVTQPALNYFHILEKLH